MKKSVFNRLLLMNIAVIAAAMLVIALLLPRLISGHIFLEKEKELTARGAELALLAEDYFAGKISEGGFADLLISLDRSLGARIWAVDEDGVVVMASYGGRHSQHGRRLRLSDEQVGRFSRGEKTVTRRYQADFDQEMLTVGVPIGPEGAAPLGAIYLHAPVTGINATVNSLLKYVLISGLAAVFLATAAGYFFSRRFSRPLLEMAGAAQGMGRGDYSGRVVVSSEDEIGQLAGSLNALAGRLEKTIGALQRGKKKFESMVTGMREGVVGVNSAGELTYFNAAARDMLGLDPVATVPGVPIEQALRGEGLAAPFLKTLSGGEPETAAVRIGESIYSIQVSPIEDEAEEKPGAVGLVRDISETKRLEKMRRDFIANVSHELRTPLTILRGYSEALLDGTAGDAERVRYLETIRREIERLNRLISDLLDLSRLQAGGIKLHQEAFNLQGLAQELKAGLQSRLEEKGIALEVDIDPEAEVLADRDRIMQVLLNLVENALRYSWEGGKIDVVGRAAGGQKVRVSVCDYGVGIEEKELPHIWERFYRIDRSRDRKQGGTGLGLAIVKEIIEAHGESVAVESIPGEGSTFSFTLPMASPSLSS